MAETLCDGRSANRAGQGSNQGDDDLDGREESRWMEGRRQDECVGLIPLFRFMPEARLTGGNYRHFGERKKAICEDKGEHDADFGQHGRVPMDTGWGEGGSCLFMYLQDVPWEAVYSQRVAGERRESPLI